jgi:hypothetical protein
MPSTARRSGRLRPDAVINELTDLPDDPAQISATGHRNIRMRREGTGNLLAATAALPGARRPFLVQSVAWDLPGGAAVAAAEQERALLEFGGVVLRYGQFYGPGTYWEARCPRRPGSTSTRPRGARWPPSVPRPAG